LGQKLLEREQIVNWSTVMVENPYIWNTDRGFLRTALRRIFGPKREEDGSWRKLHNDELHDS
jgi:hypothetical protein